MQDQAQYKQFFPLKEAMVCQGDTGEDASIQLSGRVLLCCFIVGFVDDCCIGKVEASSCFGGNNTMVHLNVHIHYLVAQIFCTGGVCCHHLHHHL